MNHSDLRSKTARYLDGELPLNERALFDGHLDQCDACGDELSEMRATIQLLRTLPSPEPPTGLMENVILRIREGEGQPGFLGRLSDTVSTLLTPRFALPAASLAAMVAVILVSNETPLQIPQLEAAWRNLRGAPDSTGNRTAGSPLVSTTVRPESSQRSTPIDGVVRVVRNPERKRPTVSAGQGMTPGSESIDTGAPTFLFRVANEQLGSMRRGPRTGPILVEDPALRVSSGLGASAASSHPAELRSVVATPGVMAPSPGGFSPLFVAEPLASNPAGSDPGFDRDNGREPALDARLDLLERHPAEFLRRLSRASLAERELWIQELAVRAIETDRSDAVLAALRGSPTVATQELGSLFAHAVERSRANLAAAVETPAE